MSTLEESLMGVMGLGGEVEGSGLSSVVKERVTLAGEGNGSKKWEQKKGKGVLRWAREAIWQLTTRRLASEINVQHMWRPVKNQEEECREGATKHPFRPRSDTASLSRVCFGCLHCSITKACWFIWKEDGKHSLTAIKVRTDLWWSRSRP